MKIELSTVGRRGRDAAQLDVITVTGEGDSIEFAYETGRAREMVEDWIAAYQSRELVLGILRDWSNGYVSTKEIED